MKQSASALHPALEPLFFNKWLHKRDRRQPRGYHPLCVTIDEQTRDYLAPMYGDSDYAVIDEIQKMSFRIANTYSGLAN